MMKRVKTLVLHPSEIEQGNVEEQECIVFAG